MFSIIKKNTLICSNSTNGAFKENCANNTNVNHKHYNSLLLLPKKVCVKSVFIYKM